MEVVGAGTPCFDAHAAALAVQYPLLPLLQEETLLLILVIAVVRLDMVKLLFVVFDLL